MKTAALNPYLPSFEYIPDGEPYVFDGRLYVFGSHDRFDGEDFCLNDYVCWSAPEDNLGNWCREGTIYKTTQDPLNADGSQSLFAPDVQQGADGRYYLYYCLHRSPTLSVAVCNTPAGQYEFYGHIRHEDGTLYGQKPGDPFNFDPGVLRDKDGKTYLYTGIAHTNPQIRGMLAQFGYLIDGSYCTELEPDMLTLKSEPKLVVPGQAVAEGTGFEGHAFFEASSPRRIGNTYYLIYSSEKSHDLCYATSNKSDGSYTYGGIIVSNGDIGLNGATEAVNYTGNTHGGLVEIEGQWYVFYHRHTNRHRQSRQGCAEAITILPDGSIPQVEMTSCGLNGGPLGAQGSHNAYIACNLSSGAGTYMYNKEQPEPDRHPYFTQTGGDREEDGDQYIANLQNGAWAGFKHFSFTGDEAGISVWVRGTGEGTLSVSSQRNGPVVAEIPVKPGAEWEECSALFKVEAGVHALFFCFNGAGSLDFSRFEIH